MVSLGDIQNGVQETIRRAFQKTVSDSGGVIVKALLTTTRNHI